MHTLGIDTLEDRTDDTIFAGGVHCLQDNQQAFLTFSIHQLLQRFDLLVQFQEGFFAVFLVAIKFAGIVGVKILKFDFLTGLDQVFFRFHHSLLSVWFPNYSRFRTNTMKSMTAMRAYVLT